MVRPTTNIAASIRRRLLNLARETEQDFNIVLVTYGLERLIYRLSVSAHRNRFILKGGMLVSLWTSDEARFTRDVDFLGFGDPDVEALKAAFAEILGIETADGLVFDVGILTASNIREDGVYGGVRLKTKAYLGKTEIPVTVDVGFGDAVGAVQNTIEVPSLIDLPTATIRAYPPEVVMAEKFQALVVLGLVNGRMKDFYDLWAIPKSLNVTDKDLSDAIAATFERRETGIPQERPDGLSQAFTADPQKMIQWRAYSDSIGLNGVSLPDVADDIWDRLGPICYGLQ
jgi:predicted nucleotidyltransferase component of viral defense system